MAFNIDPDFNYCIDSLILVDLAKIKEKRKLRYIGGDTKQNTLNEFAVVEKIIRQQIA